MTPIYFHEIIVNVIMASVTLSIADNLFFLTIGKHFLSLFTCISPTP